MADLTALIERLEKADGPSEQLDVLIENATGTAKFKREHDGIGDFDHVRADVKPLTASIDAAVALATRIMPGWRIKIQFGENYSIAQFVRGWGARADTLGVATSERPDNEICLALVTAVLRALSAQEGSK